MGAKISWSITILWTAGIVPLCFVIGNDADKNRNQWYCTGDIMKPYAMKRVRRSKSNGGGRFLDGGIESSAGQDVFLSKSCSPIARKSSSCTPPGCLSARWRIEVNVCATVSAMPPSTYIALSPSSINVLEYPSQELMIETYSIRHHYGKNYEVGISTVERHLRIIGRLEHTWLFCIVGIKFGYQPRSDSHFNKEYYSM